MFLVTLTSENSASLAAWLVLQGEDGQPGLCFPPETGADQARRQLPAQVGTDATASCSGLN